MENTRKLVETAMVLTNRKSDRLDTRLKAIKVWGMPSKNGCTLTCTSKSSEATGYKAMVNTDYSIANSLAEELLDGFGLIRMTSGDFAKLPVEYLTQFGDVRTSEFSRGAPEFSVRQNKSVLNGLVEAIYAVSGPKEKYYFRNSDSPSFRSSGIPKDRWISIHPDWVLDTRSGINLGYVERHTLFSLWLNSKPGLWSRIGKDIFKEAKITHRDLRFAVIDGVTPADGDGDFKVRRSLLTPYDLKVSLGRGLFVVDKDNEFGLDFGFLKGRVRVDGPETIPVGFDGVVYRENLKWLDPEDRKSLTEISLLRFDLVSKEDHEDSMEKRKLNRAVLTKMFKIDPIYKDLFEDMFKKEDMKLISNIESFHKDYKDVGMGIIEDPMTAFLKKDVIRSSLFLLSRERARNVAKAFDKARTSTRVPGSWMAISHLAAYGAADDEIVMTLKDWEIFKKSMKAEMARLKSGHEKASKTIGEGIRNHNVTIIRYPLEGFWSAITLKRVINDEVPAGHVIVSEKTLKTLSGDNDDHVLMTYPFSTFKGYPEGESKPTLRGDEYKITRPVTKAEAMILPAIAQGSLGFIYRALHIATDIGERGLTIRLACLLDLSAQAIKKPYELPLHWLDEAEACREGAKLTRYRMSVHTRIVLKTWWAEEMDNHNDIMATLNGGVFFDSKDRSRRGILGTFANRQVGDYARKTGIEKDILDLYRKGTLGSRVREWDANFVQEKYISPIEEAARNMDHSMFLAGCKRFYALAYTRQIILGDFHPVPERWEAYLLLVGRVAFNWRDFEGSDQEY